MRKKSIIGVIGVITILVSFLIFSRIGFSQNQTEKTDTLGIPVEVTTVGEESIREVFNYIGSIKSKNQTNLSFKQPGLIQKIYVAEGESFKKGDVLAELDAEDILAKYDIIQQKIVSAQLNVDYLKDQVDKYKILYEAGAIAEQQFLDLNYKYEMAVSGYKEALATAREIEVTLKNAKIHAPYNGSVRELFKKQGELVQPGQPVFSVSEENDLVVEVAVIEKDLAGIKIGDKALLYINNGKNEEVMEAAVATISPALNPKTRTAEIEIPVPPGSNNLLPNMSVRVSLVKGEKENVMAIPAKALVKIQDKYIVYLYQEGKALAREVKIGLNNGQKAEIIEGLTVGDKIITANLSEVKNEAKVFVYKGAE
jgi:RND family efflux transporter MFP subunit